MTSSDSAWAPGEANPPTGLQTAVGFIFVIVTLSVGLGAMVWLHFEEAAARGDFSPLQYEIFVLVIGASFAAAVLPIWWSRGSAVRQLVGIRRVSPRIVLQWTIFGILVYAVVIVAALAFRFASGQQDTGFAATLSTAATNIQQSGALVIYGVLCGVVAQTAMTVALLGVLLPWMRRRLSLIACATVQSLVLGAPLVWSAPSEAIHVAALTFLAVVARERTGSIWPPMAMSVTYVVADIVLGYADLGL